MATITAVTSSFIDEYLDVLDPNTWVGGVVPGPSDTAVFPSRTHSNYRSTAAANPNSTYFFHPILAPWSGSKYGRLGRDGENFYTASVRINASSTTNLGLEEQYTTSGSFLTTLYPWYGPYNMVKIDYEAKTSTQFQSCSIDHSYKRWAHEPPNGVWTSSVNYDADAAYGRFYYNQCYFLRNMNQYQLTGSATWSVGHIDMQNWTEFKIKDAKLELTSTTPYIDMTAGAYQKLQILGNAHIQVSCSAGVNTSTTGIYSYLKSYQMIIISGSENFSSSFVATNASEDDTTLTMSDSHSFVEGDIISISNNTNPKFLNRYSMNNNYTDYGTGNALGYRKYLTSSFQGNDGALTNADRPIVNLDNPYGRYGMSALSGSIMKSEWALVATSSGADLTIEKLLTDRGWVEEELGQYTYDQFVETFGQTPPDTYEGTKTAVLFNSFHRNYKSGDKVIINKKAYTLNFVGTHLKQDILYDFSSGSGDLDPHDVFVYSDNEMSGSFYSDTLLQGTYYSWPEYYRKGTLWGSGSHTDIHGNIISSGSWFLDPNKLRSWGAYGTPYNYIRYDTYLAADHHISGSYFIEGEIEVSASVADDPFHNTQQERRFDESGSRWNPDASVWIQWPCNPYLRGSSNNTYTQGPSVVTNTRANRNSHCWGFEGKSYGLTKKTANNNDYGLFIPVVQGLGNDTISGSIRAYNPSYGTMKAYPYYASMSMAQGFVRDFAPSFNCTGSGESFSIKLVRKDNRNDFFYRDKGGEFLTFQDYSNTVDQQSVRLAIRRGTHIYSISIKGRYQLALLDSNDTGFERLNNITRAGLIFDKDTSYKAEFLGTKVVDAMGYKNLLRDWHYKRGKSSQYCYVQGFTYNSSTYNSGIGYINDYYGNGVLFGPSEYGKASNYWSYPWSNAGCHYTFDFGTNVTFDTIGLRVNYDSYGEGVRTTTQYGAGNSMTNIGIEYTLDGTTNFSDHNTASFKITAPDPRQSTGRGNPIRFYTGSQEITARVIRIKNAGGSRGTSTTRLGFLGAYSGISGSTPQLKLASTKHFQVGDLIYFWSYQLGPDGDCHNLDVAETSYYNWFRPQYVTDYDEGDYFQDVEPRTVGGFRQEYEIVAIDRETNIVTLDRDPVHDHIEEDTLVFKANRGSIKFDSAHYGRDRNGCNIRIGYGSQLYVNIRNVNMLRGFISLNSTTGYWHVMGHAANVFVGSKLSTQYGFYSSYSFYDSAFYHNIMGNSGFYGGTTNGRGNSGKYAFFGGLFLADGQKGYFSWNARQVPRETNFLISVGGYGQNHPYGYLGSYNTTNGNLPTKTIKIANIFYTGYYSNFENYGFHNYQNLFKVIDIDKDFKNVFRHTYQRSRGQSHGYSDASSIWLKHQNNLEKDARIHGLWKYPGHAMVMWNGTYYAPYNDYRNQIMPQLELNHEVFKKDVIGYQGNAWSNYMSTFYILKNADNDFSLVLSGQFPYSNTGDTGQGAHEIKTCEILVKEDTQIRIKFSMDFKYTFQTILGLGEHDETSANYPIQDFRYSWADDNFQSRNFIFAVIEYNENNVIEQTIFAKRLAPESLDEYQNFTLDETINFKEGRVYRICLINKIARPDHWIYVLCDYKNPSFILLAEDKSKYIVLKNNWNMEKLFNNENFAFQLRAGGEGFDFQENPIVQSNNLTDPTKVIKINKVKL